VTDGARAPGFEVIAAEETPLGLIWLRERALASEPGGVVAEISLDHEFLMSSATTDSERALASRAVALHGGAALQALVGGLGLGATAHELLRSPRVASVRVVELLQPILDWHAQGLVPLAAELRADARFAVERGDVYLRLLAEPRGLYDLILVDVDHSPEERLGPTSESFYAAESLARAKRQLAPAGVFGVWSYAESARFEAELRAVFAEVRAERIAFANALDGVREENWLYFGRG
jgi:spermidine synthase